jgi:hypothetical protein
MSVVDSAIKGLMTPRGLIRILSWDAWDSDTVNIDVEVIGYDSTNTLETWYNVPRTVVNYLGVDIDARYTNKGEQ